MKIIFIYIYLTTFFFFRSNHNIYIERAITIFMVENYFVNVRRIQKAELLRFIQEHKDISLEKALGLFSLKTGLKITTLKIYLYELKSAGLIE